MSAALRRIPFGLYRGLRLTIDPRSQKQLYLGLAERETHPFLRRALARAHWVIDVGAGQGELTILAARTCDLVHACDPDPACQAALAVHRAANPGRAWVIPCDGFIGQDVPLDTLVVPLAELGLLKIDAEGAEHAILASGTRLLTSGPRDVLVETHSAELECACRAWLVGHGYTVQVVRPAWWRRVIPEHRPLEHNQWLIASRPRGETVAQELPSEPAASK